MTLVIHLTLEEEARLQAAARRLGVDPVECARRVLSEHLPPVQPGAATLALFAVWEAEDTTDNPEELAARQRAWDELKASMNANRAATGEGPLFP